MPDYTPAQEEPTPDNPAARSSSNINYLDDYFAIEEEYYNYLGNNFISALQDNISQDDCYVRVVLGNTFIFMKVQQCIQVNDYIYDRNIGDITQKPYDVNIKGPALIFSPAEDYVQQGTTMDPYSSVELMVELAGTVELHNEYTVSNLITRSTSKLADDYIVLDSSSGDWEYLLNYYWTPFAE